MKNINNGEKFFCSWSGGKDSCLALHRAFDAGAVPKYLLTIIHEDGERSRSHSIPVEVLQAQADSMKIPLITKPAAWSEYEDVFIGALREIREKDITCGVFGDIDFIQHLEWEEKVCKASDMKPYLPLWKCGRRELVEEFLTIGYKAMIVTVNTRMLDGKYIGEELSKELIGEFEGIGIDPCGENGEYHTVVFDGPLFSEKLLIKKNGIVHKDEYVFLDFSL
ncbi:diphthine--ammonia ligase [Verrucomicrobiota bacterium]